VCGPTELERQSALPELTDHTQSWYAELWNVAAMERNIGQRQRYCHPGVGSQSQGASVDEAKGHGQEWEDVSETRPQALVAVRDLADDFRIIE